MAHSRTLIACPVKRAQKQKEWASYMRQYNKNRPEKRRATEKRRRDNDPIFRIRQNMRRRVKLALNGEVGASTAMKYVGCDSEQLKAYLENKFTGPMTWENYGSYWQIDHIKPVSLFDLTLDDNLKLVNNYTNLQPMEKIANIKKGNKYGR